MRSIGEGLDRLREGSKSAGRDLAKFGAIAGQKSDDAECRGTKLVQDAISERRCNVAATKGHVSAAREDLRCGVRAEVRGAGK